MLLPQPRSAVAKPRVEKVEPAAAAAAAATPPAQPLVAAVAEEQESSSAEHDKGDQEGPPKPYRPLPQTPTSKEREVAVKALKDPCLKTCGVRTARPGNGQHACGSFRAPILQPLVCKVCKHTFTQRGHLRE